MEKKSKKYPNNANVIFKECPICGKQISSLSQSQFDYNYEQHMLKHEREVKKDE